MKINILLLIILISFFSATAQENENVERSDTTKTYLDLLFEYRDASQERKDEIDLFMADYENFYKSRQVTSICGVEFGKSRDEVLPVLENKFGEQSKYSDKNTIIFENIKYAGLDFDKVYFIFQSDGYKTYFNTCIFVNSFKTKEDAERRLFQLKFAIEGKYRLHEEDEQLRDNPYFSGGVSPLWDGKWYTLVENSITKIFDPDFYQRAVWTDVIEYEDSIVKDLGVKYGARLIYGPFNYVKEEF